jgi:hypothetical protein
LGVIVFVGADPTFAALENLTAVLTSRPGQDDGFQDRVRQGSGVSGVSLAMVPLLTSAGTIGTLGFIKFGDREWQHDESTRCRRWPRCWPNSSPGWRPRNGSGAWPTTMS